MTVTVHRGQTKDSTLPADVRSSISETPRTTTKAAKQRNACVNESFMSFDTSVQDIRKALLLEAGAKGKQPKCCYNQGLQESESTKRRF